MGYPGALGQTMHVAVGTDGYPADMEAEHAALAEAAHRHEGLAADASELARRRAGGWRLASQRFPSVGRFGPEIGAGGAADLVVGERGQRPRHVLVAGRMVVEDGRLVRADLDEIRARASEEAPRLWRRMEAYEIR